MACSLTMFKKGMMVALVMKRLFSALGLVALLNCEPAEKDFSYADRITAVEQESKAEPEYPASANVTAKMVMLDYSTVPAYDGSILYLDSSTANDAPHQDLIGPFYFPYGLYDPQFDLLYRNLGKNAHVEGVIMKDRTSINNPRPIIVEHSIFGGFLRTPLYTAAILQVQRDLPTHLELSSNRLRKKISEERTSPFCPDSLSRYFVAFEDTLVTVCADNEPNAGLAHKIDYRRDEIGQPTYLVE